MHKHFIVFLIIFLSSSKLVSAQSLPVAQDDNNTAFLNTTLTVDAPGLLANDSDADGDTLTITQFSIGGVNFNVGEIANFNQGTIVINTDGSYTFTPTADFLGNTDVINYSISDGTSTNNANLNILVTHPPTSPEANDDSITIFINTSLNEAAPGLMLNDTDINGDVLSITQFSINSTTYNAGESAVFSQGSIRISADGSYEFIPTSNFVGNVETINYSITDGTFTSSANLNISVIHPPTPPEASNVYDTADINTTLNVPAPGVLFNDTDLNEDVLTIASFSINGVIFNAGQTANLTEGDFTLNQDGSYILVPAPNFTGELPTIVYTITDSNLTATANLFISVEPTENLLEKNSFSSCNQGYTANGEYKVRYTAVYTNRSNAKDYHEPSLIRNIDITSDLQAAFGNGCVIRVDEMNVYNNTFTKDYVNDGAYPREFNNDALNDNFGNVTSTSIFNTNAINNLVLYPRQNMTIIFCVTVDPFCDGRPNPTPSGSGIDFTNTINASSNRGNTSDSVTVTDFHTTEAVVTAGLFIPEFNDSLDPPGVINPDGTYDYNNRVIITNEGSATATNVNFNMGLGSFLDNGITFNEIRINQVSGPAVNINTNYDGDTNTNLLLPNNSLDAGETIILELFYLIEAHSSSSYSYFYQNSQSQTQGTIDGFDESTAANRRRYSHVIWSDNLGNHLDRYYKTTSPTDPVSSSLQCDCRRSSMRFLYTSSSSVSGTFTKINAAPNTILEHEELLFSITITNTSESVDLNNLQLEDNINSVCGGNLVSVGLPVIENSTATTNPILNPSFNGITDVNIFDGTSGTLGADESITIQFPVVVNEACYATNNVTFTSKDPLRSITSSAIINIDAFTDSDNDGIINSLDIDDDNDTILDVLEYDGLNPLEDDDADLIPNYRDIDFGVDANGDGIVDLFDFDGDGVANHLDLDSDNDGILDIVEAGNTTLDTNSDGRTNGNVGVNGLDDTLETNDSFTANINYTLPNSDSDILFNFLDIDSDNDGIVDNIEAQSTNSYITLSNTFSLTGIDTAYPNGLPPIDTDLDSVFDYIDINSDNDIRDDIIEGWDTNSDGIPETTISNLDSDNDGLDDAFDINDSLVNPTNNQTPLSFPNVDNVDNPERDWRESIAIVVLVENASAVEGNDLVFNISLVTKNDNSILIESTSPITINFTTSNGTATTNIYDVATAPFDYSAISNIAFTIPANTLTETITITSLEDNIFEISELFTLTGTITSTNTINTEIVSIGTILDNDDPPDISMDNSRAEEGVDLIHTITISHPSSTPIDIEINTSDDLAFASLDYTTFAELVSISGTIDPSNANTEVSFSVATLLDNLNELDEETLHVIGIVLSSGNTGVKDLVKTGIILDVDPNPFIEISSEAIEEGGILSFSINLLNANKELMQNYLPINLLVETLDQTTAANLDYNSFSILTVIPASSTGISQNITTIDDRLNENTEIFHLQATVNLSNTSNTFNPFGVGTIKDNDYPNLFSPNSDGKSDFFKISGIIEDYPNFKIEIFNRQGNKVFSYSNNGSLNPLWWDGNYNGKPAPVGVYFYTLDFNDGVKQPKTAFVQLIR